MVKMVDFNNETTVSTPAVDVVRILILQRRNDVIESIEHYYKTAESNVEADLGVIKARILSLYLELQGLVDKKLDEEIQALSVEIFDSDIKELLDVFTKINKLLYDINLTKIDVRLDYDTTDIEAENKIHNL